MREEAVLFGEANRLSGVITDPPAGQELPGAPAVVVVHAGRIHRVGPNRIYVSLARTLASLGFTVLRFDLSGIGESDPRRDDTPFHQAEIEDVVEAMDYLATARGSRRFALTGICSGASLSAVCALRDERVASAILINAQGYPLSRGQRLRARSRKFARYWWKVLLRHPSSLERVLRHRGPQQELLAAEIDPSEARGQSPERVLVELRDRGVQILIVYSESDPGLDYLRVTCGRELRASLASGTATLAVVPGADHVFTLLASQRRLVEAVSSWLSRTFANADAAEKTAAGRGR